MAYKSSLNEEGCNVALFDPQKAKCIGCRMYEIKKIRYDFEESGSAISLSDDGKVLYPRITDFRHADEYNREKKNSNNGKLHNK